MSADIHAAGPDDAEVLAALHARSFTAPWDAAAFRRLLSQPGCDALVVNAPAAVGFIVVRTVVDESEVLTVAVDPDMRGRGLAGRLLAEALTRMSARGSRACYLEVAHDNDAAIALYRAHRFVPCGQRPSYYARGENAANAIIMKRGDNSGA